jgi:hypothetical protein
MKQTVTKRRYHTAQRDVVEINRTIDVDGAAYKGI